MGMFTKSELEMAKSVDLRAVASAMGYTIKRVGKLYTIKEMDSIRIYPDNHWYRWSGKSSTGITGGSQIDFMMEFAVMIREELEKNYLPKERIRWATRIAEQNSIVLLDAVNTLLHMLKAEACIPVEIAAHPVVKQSQDRIKEKIAYFKQKSDERKSKEQG